MARAIKTDLATPADAVRELLARCENRLVNPTMGGGVPELFGWMDEIMAQWPDLEATGADLRAEQARWETVQAQTDRRGRQLLQAWPSAQPLSALRQALAPPQSHWWWWLDERVAQARQQRGLRVLAIGGAMLVVAVVAIYVLSRLFPVDPTVREVNRLQNEIDQVLMNSQDFQAVRALAEQGVAIAPDDPDLQLVLGVAQQVLGDPQRAAAQWAAARQLLPDDAAFLTQRGRTYLMFNRPQEALQDVQAAVALQPDSAIAHFYLGMALEATEQRTAALVAYERAAELAGENAQLVVMARTRLSALLQQPAPQAVNTATP